MLEAETVQGDLRIRPGVLQTGLHLYGAGRVVGGVLLNTQIGCDLADDVAYDRRHDLTGVVLEPTRVVQQNEHLDFRIIDGQYSGKAHHLIIIAVTAQVAVGALCRAGLAADAVARHIGVGAGVVVPFPVDIVFHHGKQLAADLLGDDLTADTCLGLGDDVAVLIGDGIHHIGGDQIAAVGNGRHGRGHLHRGYGLVLAEGCRIEVCIDLRHLLGVVDACPAGLIGQVDAGGLGEAERLNIVVEYLRLQCFGCLNEPEVAAVVQRTRHVLFIVDIAVGAAVGMLPPLASLIDGQAAAAVEGLAGAHDAGIQPCRCGDELEHRAGHIQLSDVLILPLCLAHHTLQLGVFAGDLVAVLINRFIAADLAVSDDVLDRLFPKAALQPVDVLGVDLLFIQNGRHFGIRDLVWVVGVKLLDGCHSQNCAGLDIHNDGAAAAVYREGVHRLGQVLLHDGLHIFVNRQVQIVAVNGLVQIRLA